MKKKSGSNSQNPKKRKKVDSLVGATVMALYHTSVPGAPSTVEGVVTQGPDRLGRYTIKITPPLSTPPVLPLDYYFTDKNELSELFLPASQIVPIPSKITSIQREAVRLFLTQRGFVGL